MRRTEVTRRRAPSPAPVLRRSEPVTERPSVRGLAPYATTLAVAAAVFLVAYDQASSTDASRTTLAIGVWWAILLAVVVGFLPLARVPRAALAVAGLLAALAAWTLASTAWSASAERAYVEFGRTALFVGILVVAVIAAAPASGGRWADGIALGITAVAVLALVTRFFPSTAPENEFQTVLTSAYTRLSYPLGYWNGLAIFTGIAFPLLLRAALVARNALLRGIALAPLPALAATIYLTSSRGGVATAVAGTFVFLLLSTRRWAALAAAVLAGAASVGAIAVLQARHELVNGPLNTAAAASQGHTAALLIGGLCALAALAWAAGTALVDHRAPRSAALERAAAALVVIVAAVGIAVAQPVQWFHDFKQPPVLTASEDPVKEHLLSTNGSGRYQLWTAAADEFETEPLHGRGAGSYETWWNAHGSLAAPVKDAHSLYVELLGELGIVGFVLLVGAFLLGVATGIRRALTYADEARIGVAGMTGAFVAYGVGAGVDWMWELTAVSVVGIVLLGLLCGPGTGAARRRRYTDAYDLPRRRLAPALRAAVALAASFVVLAEGVSLLANTRIGDSEAAVQRGDPAAALDSALAAKSIEPWAASPYVQLALVEELDGNLASAERWIGDAIDRDPDNWTVWITRARIQTKRGEIDAASASLAEARRLNPRSAFFKPANQR